MSIAAVSSALNFGENNSEEYKKNSLRIITSSGEKINGIVSIISEYDSLEGKSVPIVMVKVQHYGDILFIDPKYIVSACPLMS
ncbi:hypothetical protein JK164_08080 [Gluconobacter kondonii]|uniref:hypothetical protein n=1 Tax=Gluconobacter kondonii TaxID=941463 RepID=UPI001B8AE540|nr:hypothetical protein [Gluconobacter kondonii]MBS1065916.1 hypothetical protein [Gluconobacter kondonii]